MIDGIEEDMAGIVEAGGIVTCRRRCDAEKIAEVARERGVKVDAPRRDPDGRWSVEGDR